MRKVAVVTGASRGIGKGIAIQLAKSGFDVAVAARSVRENDVTPWPGTIHKTAEPVRKEGRQALPIGVDLTNMDKVRSLFDQTIKEFGRIDVMVNNAQYVGEGHHLMFTDTTWEDLEMKVKVNVLAPLLLHHLCVPVMIKQGGGIFINVGARAGFDDNPDLPGRGSTSLAYGVTKAAFNRIATTLAKEMREHNIAVVNLSPGSVNTERLTETAMGMGFGAAQRHTVRVPAVAAAYLATVDRQR